MSLTEYILARPNVNAAALVKLLNRPQSRKVETKTKTQSKPPDQIALEQRFLDAIGRQGPLDRLEVSQLAAVVMELQAVGIDTAAPDFGENEKRVSVRRITADPSLAVELIGRPVTIKDVKTARANNDK